jgi:hypothetical protein
MSFNIDSVLGDMLSAVKNSAGADWDAVNAHARRVLQDEKESLVELAEQRLQGDITEEELKSELGDERDTIEAEFQAIQGMTKPMAQKAANAVIKILLDAIRAAL